MRLMKRRLYRFNQEERTASMGETFMPLIQKVITRMQTKGIRPMAENFETHLPSTFNPGVAESIQTGAFDALGKARSTKLPFVSLLHGLGVTSSSDLTRAFSFRSSEDFINALSAEAGKFTSDPRATALLTRQLRLAFNKPVIGTGMVNAADVELSTTVNGVKSIITITPDVANRITLQTLMDGRVAVNGQSCKISVTQNGASAAKDFAANEGTKVATQFQWAKLKGGGLKAFMALLVSGTIGLLGYHALTSGQATDSENKGLAPFQSSTQSTTPPGDPMAPQSQGSPFASQEADKLIQRLHSNSTPDSPQSQYDFSTYGNAPASPSGIPFDPNDPNQQENFQFKGGSSKALFRFGQDAGALMANPAETPSDTLDPAKEQAIQQFAALGDPLQAASSLLTQCFGNMTLDEASRLPDYSERLRRFVQMANDDAAVRRQTRHRFEKALGINFDQLASTIKEKIQ